MSETMAPGPKPEPKSRDQTSRQRKMSHTILPPGSGRAVGPVGPPVVAQLHVRLGEADGAVEAGVGRAQAEAALDEARRPRGGALERPGRDDGRDGDRVAEDERAARRGQVSATVASAASTGARTGARPGSHVAATGGGVTPGVSQRAGEVERPLGRPSPCISTSTTVTSASGCAAYVTVARSGSVYDDCPGRTCVSTCCRRAAPRRRSA